LNSSLEQIAPITDKMSASNNGSGGEDPLKALIGSIPGNSVRTPKVESGERKYEFGFTLQTTRVSSIYPSMADIALTAGYNVKKKLSIGGGISYKMGRAQESIISRLQIKVWDSVHTQTTNGKKHFF
jgi:hypothetical protein